MSDIKYRGLVQEAVFETSKQTKTPACEVISTLQVAKLRLREIKGSAQGYTWPLASVMRLTRHFSRNYLETALPVTLKTLISILQKQFRLFVSVCLPKLLSSAYPHGSQQTCLSVEGGCELGNSHTALRG